MGITDEAEELKAVKVTCNSRKRLKIYFKV